MKNITKTFIVLAFVAMSFAGAKAHAYISTCDDCSGASYGSSSSLIASSTDLNQPALVTTENPTNITASSATLTGNISTGSSTTVFFQYGKTSALGMQSAIRLVGPSSSATEVDITVNNLAPNTAYYYRIVAQNAAGITDGDLVNVVTTQSVAAAGSTVASQGGTNSTANTASTTTAQSNSSVSANGNQLGASAANGYSSFLPSNIWGWILVFLLILAIIIIARHIANGNADNQDAHAVPAH